MKLNLDNKNIGLIHLYHGDGKGKTTCACGLALRFSSYNKKILIIQFLKDGSSGEIKALSKLDNVTILAKKATPSFTWNMTDDEKQQTKILHDNEISSAINSDYDMIVLDELCGAMSNNLIDTTLVKKLLDTKKDYQEIIITGRNPEQFILDKADYITQMTLERHPYEKGIPSRQGIEF